MNGTVEIKGAARTMPSHTHLSLNSNCKTPELEFSLTHSKQMIASHSNRNKSGVLSDGPNPRETASGPRITSRDWSDEHGIHGGDAA
jgi:hypothetical protein